MSFLNFLVGWVQILTGFELLFSSDFAASLFLRVIYRHIISAAVMKDEVQELNKTKKVILQFNTVVIFC